MNQKLLLFCLPLFAQMLHLAPAQTLQNQWLKNMNKGYETYPADIQISQTGNVVASLPMIYLDSVNQNHTKAWAMLDKNTGNEIWDSVLNTTGNLCYTATADANDNLYVAEHDNFNLYFKKFSPTGQQLFGTTLNYHRLMYFDDIITNNYENLTFLPSSNPNKLYLFVDKLADCNWRPTLVSIDKTSGAITNLDTIANACYHAMHSHCTDANGNLYALHGNDTTLTVTKWNGTQFQPVLQLDSAGFLLPPRSVKVVGNKLFVQYAVRNMGVWTDLYNVLKIYDLTNLTQTQSYFTTKILDAPKVANNEYYITEKVLTIGYFQNNNTAIKKYDANGNLVWTYLPPANYSYNDMVIQGNNLFLMTDNQANTHLTVVNKTTGVKDSTFVLPEFALVTSYVNSGGFKLKTNPQSSSNIEIYVSGAVWEPHFTVHRLIAKIGKYIYTPKKVEIETAQHLDFSIYPNPTTQHVTISLQEPNAVMRVFNLTGQKIMEQNLLEEANQIHLPSLVAGSYLIQIQSGNKISTQKLMIINE